MLGCQHQVGVAGKHLERALAGRARLAAAVAVAAVLLAEAERPIASLHALPRQQDACQTRQLVGRPAFTDAGR